MQPYVIRQGDYLEKLAYSFGFDRDTVWNDDKNADLRKLRPDHNILCPGDVLYIPEKNGNSVASALVTGATNDFAASAPAVTIAVRFTGQGIASQPCSVRELDSLTGLTTDADGLLSFSAPLTLDTITVSLDALGLCCACRVGGLDPMATASGVYQRLQNLGYIPADLPFDALDPAPLRAGLRGLRWSLLGADAFVAPSRADPIPPAMNYGPSADDSPQGDGARATRRLLPAARPVPPRPVTLTLPRPTGQRTGWQSTARSTTPPTPSCSTHTDADRHTTR